MTTQDEQWTENKDKIDDTDYGLLTCRDCKQTYKGYEGEKQAMNSCCEDCGEADYDDLAQNNHYRNDDSPEQEPEAVESEREELEW